MAGPGKVFEEDFKLSCDADEAVDYNRLKDPIGGQAGVANICDYIAYLQPYIYYLELKSRQGNTLNFKEITRTQWDGLMKKASIDGTVPGVLVNFSDHDEAYFVHIAQLQYLRDVNNKKSLHINDAREFGVKLPGRKKVTRFAYYVKDFLVELGECYG